MKYNLTQAAKAVKISRSTLHKDIKDGKVSVKKDGKDKPYIELVELERVYGSVTTSDMSETVKTAQPRTEEKTENTLLELQTKIQILEADKTRLGEQVDELKEDRNQWRQQATNLLTDQRPKGSGWFDKLLGRI